MQIFQVDAFTTTAFTGNPASVVLGADALDDAQLQAIAREFSHAETAFVLPPDAPDHDLRLRFFNAKKEAAFVGHATLAAHAVLLTQGLRPPGIQRQKSGTGILEVSAVGADERRAAVEFRQGAPILEAPLAAADALRVARALGVDAQCLHDGLPARVARKGNGRLLLPLSHPSGLDALQPQVEQLLTLGREFNVEGFFAISLPGERQGEPVLRTQSRMFCPALGIAEDPVSGNAHSMLAALLWEHGRLDLRNPGFIGVQGVQMKRPGEVRVQLDIDKERMSAARIGGDAVIVSSGRLVL